MLRGFCAGGRVLRSGGSRRFDVLTGCGGSVEQVELMVDESLTVMDGLHVDVFILHCVELEKRKIEISVLLPDQVQTRQQHYIVK